MDHGIVGAQEFIAGVDGEGRIVRCREIARRLLQVMGQHIGGRRVDEIAGEARRFHGVGNVSLVAALGPDEPGALRMRFRFVAREGVAAERPGKGGP